MRSRSSSQAFSRDIDLFSFFKARLKPKLIDITLDATIDVTIKTLTGKTAKFCLEPTTTGADLKNLIYQKCCQSLEIHQMSVRYQGNIIGNNQTLSERNIINKGKEVVIHQFKKGVTEIENITADAQGEDPISLEKGVAKMACGHWIGQNSLIALIRSIISDKKCQIRCPFCFRIWNYKDCQKVGVFTKEESLQFETGLSLNWIHDNTKKCPSCKSQIYKADLTTDLVTCTHCDSGDFCYLCLRKWRWIGQPKDLCGNQGCPIPKDILNMCAYDRVFSFKINGETKEIKTPIYRFCPKCKELIQNYTACKHTTCKCGHNFCWICLSSSQPSWPCGRYNEYCGKVAPIQNK